MGAHRCYVHHCHSCNYSIICWLKWYEQPKYILDMEGTDRFIAIALTMAVAFGFMIGCCCCFWIVIVRFTQPHCQGQVIAERFLQLKFGTCDLHLFNDCHHLKKKEPNPVDVCKDCKRQLANGRHINFWMPMTMILMGLSMFHVIAQSPLGRWQCQWYDRALWNTLNRSLSKNTFDVDKKLFHSCFYSAVCINDCMSIQRGRFIIQIKFKEAFHWLRHLHVYLFFKCWISGSLFACFRSVSTCAVDCIAEYSLVTSTIIY